MNYFSLIYLTFQVTTDLSVIINVLITIEIDNDEWGVIGDFTTIRDIRITKAEPEWF